MAKVSTYAIGFAVGSGNREDVLEQISLISPSDTPFLATAPRSTAKHDLHSWMTDTLAATSTAGVAEGADFVTSANTVRVRITNPTQIFRRTVVVSNTQRAVNPIGVDDEYKYQVFKAGREIHRNIEKTFFAASGACATGSTGAARLMKRFNDLISGTLGRSIRSWGEGVSTGASATNSATSLTDDRINGMLEHLFQVGGNPDVIYVGSAGKRDISRFSVASNVRRNIDLAEKRLVAPVDFYDSEYGPIELTLSRWVGRGANTSVSSTSLLGQIYALERSLNRVAVLRPIKHVPLSPIGDAVRGMVIGEVTLECLNPTGNARGWGINSRALNS